MQQFVSMNKSVLPFPSCFTCWFAARVLTSNNKGDGVRGGGGGGNNHDDNNKVAAEAAGDGYQQTNKQSPNLTRPNKNIALF